MSSTSHSPHDLTFRVDVRIVQTHCLACSHTFIPNASPRCLIGLLLSRPAGRVLYRTVNSSRAIYRRSHMRAHPRMVICTHNLPWTSYRQVVLRYIYMLRSRTISANTSHHPYCYPVRRVCRALHAMLQPLGYCLSLIFLQLLILLRVCQPLRRDILSKPAIE